MYSIMSTNFKAATFTLGVLVLPILWIISGFIFPRKNRQLPPGPRPFPLVGNILQLPSEFQERTLLTWGRRYGAIVFARLFHKPAIIVNSVDVARDLLDKRGQFYSSRPLMVLMTDL